MRVLKKDGTPWEIKDEDILQFHSHQNTLYVTTPEGDFIYPTSLSDVLITYHDLGYERLDRSNVVNTHKVEGYDSQRKIVQFVESPDIFAVVSEPNEPKIKRILASKSNQPKKEG